MSKPIEFRPLAVQDLEEALAWYDARSANAGARLRAEVVAAVDAIARSPEAWPNHIRGTRRYSLKRFPISIVYRNRGEMIEIVAVAHNARGPGYWGRRLND